MLTNLWHQAMTFKSTTTVIPEVRMIPRHIAIIMDGNGRWARQRMLPRLSCPH